MPHENESHDELLAYVEAGRACVLSDETLPGGRFQVVATVIGRGFVVVQWHQDAGGDWNSQSRILLQPDAAARLIGLLHSSGVATGVARVK